MTGATFQDLNYSDNSDTESFIVIQGINSRICRNISTILKKIRILK
jgi:hypothetical protein